MGRPSALLRGRFFPGHELKEVGKPTEREECETDAEEMTNTRRFLRPYRRPATLGRNAITGPKGPQHKNGGPSKNSGNVRVTSTAPATSYLTSQSLYRLISVPPARRAFFRAV